MLLKNLPIIVLEQTVHKKNPRLLIRFPYDSLLIQHVRQIHDATWSKTLRAWHVTDTKDNLASILAIFKDVATLDISKICTNEVFRRNLTEAQRTLLNNFYLYLKGKRYSKSTIQTYTFFVADFVNFHTETALEELTNRSV